MFKPIKRITISAVNGVRGGFKNVTERKQVAFVVGICHHAKLKPSEDQREGFKFTGEFYAENAKGQAYVSPVLYLPGSAQLDLAKAMESAKAHEFAFVFHVKPSSTAPLGYVMEVTPVLAITPNDAISDVIKRAKLASKNESKPATPKKKSTHR